MAKVFVKMPASACAHCGGPVSNVGPKPKDGRRFCAAKPCRAAKAVLYRARTVETREAPLQCAGCGRAVPPRIWRSGDELGRWCHKAACKVKRRQARDAVAGGIDLTLQVARQEIVIDLLRDAVAADAEDCTFQRRVVCAECGLTTALIGWAHPANVAWTGICFGTLDGMPKRAAGREGMQHAWPFPLEFLDDDQRATLAEMG